MPIYIYYCLECDPECKSPWEKRKDSYKEREEECPECGSQAKIKPGGFVFSMTGGTPKFH